MKSYSGNSGGIHIIWDFYGKWHKFQPASFVLNQEFFFALYLPSFVKEGKTDVLVPDF